MRLMLVPLALLALTHLASADPKPREAWVIFRGGNDSATMSGTMSDVERAKRLRRGDETLLYARRGDAAFVVRDPAILGRALALYQPMEPLQKRMEGKGRVMEVLGKKMKTLSGKMVAGPVADHERYGVQMQALGEVMEKLGEEQRVLGEEMQKVAEDAERRLKVLLDEAIRTGKTSPAL
jgi:hypothetical protein